MNGAFFEYSGEQAKDAQGKLGCGHFGPLAQSVEYRGKRICAKCAALVMDGQGQPQSVKQGGPENMAPSKLPGQSQAKVSQVPEPAPTQPQAGEGSQAEGAAQPGKGEPQDGEGNGQGQGKGDGQSGDDSPVMHSEFDPSKQAKADKKRDEAIKILGQRMDGGQREIELAKKAFDSHETRLNAHDAQIKALEASGIQNVQGIDARLEKLESQRAKVIKIYKDAGDKKPDVIEGTHHIQFPLLLQTCSARLPDGHRMNVWLRGPAGSGKTTAAANVAKALGLQFAFNGALDSEYKLKGFVDATGKCVSTPFRKIWTEGGVYLFDEVDASLPSAVLGFNAALANARCDFPDANIERHKDCIVIAAANTFGGGATADYVGRAKQDAAFLDRFVQIDWTIDELLETALTANPSWSSYVQTARRRVAERGLKGIIVSPRASLFGAAMLAAGVDAKKVIEMTIYKGMTPDQRSALDLASYKA